MKAYNAQIRGNGSGHPLGPFPALVTAGIVLSLALTGCMQPPLMLAPARSPILRRAVWFYLKPNWPRHYKLLARLDTNELGGFSSLATDCLVLKKLQKQAARIGANAILLKDPPPPGNDSDGDGDMEPDMDGSPMNGYNSPNNFYGGGGMYISQASPTFHGYAAYAPNHPKAHAVLMKAISCGKHP